MHQAVPLHYELTIEPDMEAFTFSGTVEVTLQAEEPVESIVLNVLDLTVSECSVYAGRVWQSCGFAVEESTESLAIRLPEAVSGTLRCRVVYTGVVGKGMAGFYRSGYTEDGRLHHIAVTQFQESDARRAFPCVDRPSAKATFGITLVTPSHLTAVANTAVAEETPVSGEKKRVRFRQTPKMSTYLVFFGVGAFEITPDLEDPRVRSVTLPGRVQQAAFGLSFGRKTLAFCERYYGIDYPLEKLDLIAVPDFAFGAMENWGAVTFRENLLLHQEGVVSRSAQARICEVIAHEIAHQWFGNLVTPADWCYLWLNESFATYFGYGVVDHYYPEWETWAHFIHGQTRSALNRDSLQRNFPIEIPGGEHVVINTSTAPIIYSKGASILRQIEAFIGPDAFQQGLHSYLVRHQYGTAESRHLWEALEASASMPVTAIMESWVGQPGHPILTVSRSGETLHLEQRRFAFLSESPPQTWRVPVTIRLWEADGSQRTVSAVLEKEAMEVSVGTAAAYKVNDGHAGFYRVRYRDSANVQALKERIQRKELTAEDRWGLANDMVAQVKCGDLPLDDYLFFLGAYRDEDAFLPVAGIADDLHQLWLLTDGPERARIARTGREQIRPVLGRIGLEPAADEAHAMAILRDQLIWHSVLYGDDAVTAFASEKFNVLLAGGSVHADIRKSVMQAGAHGGGREAFAGLKDRFLQTDSEHERMNTLIAMGCFRTEDIVRRVQDFVLDAVPDRNRFIAVAALCANPTAVQWMWDWFLEKRERLEASHPLLYERIVGSILTMCGIRSPEAVQAFFTAYADQRPELKDVIHMSLEILQVHLQVRKAAASKAASV